MEDKIEIDADLDEHHNAARRIAARHLSGTDELRYTTQGRNDFKRRLEVSEQLNVCSQSSRSLWKDHSTGLKRN